MQVSGMHCNFGQCTLVPLDPREKLYILGFCISWYLIQLPWRNLKLHGFMESKSMESLTKIPKIQNLIHCLVHDRSLSLDRPYILNHILRIYGETYQIKNLYILAGYSESSHLRKFIDGNTIKYAAGIVPRIIEGHLYSTQLLNMPVYLPTICIQYMLLTYSK